MTNPVVGTQSQLDGSTKAASTSYVDTAVANAVAGINPAVAVQAATTAAGNTSGLTYSNGASGVGATFTGTNNTAITIDGYTFTAIGQRLLVKNDTQSPSGAFNGIYYLTQVQALALPPIFTRALDYDQPSDMNNTGAIPVINGTVNGTTQWVLTSQVVTVGTTPLTYVKFSGNPATYLLAANNLSDVSTAATAFNNISPMTTGGDLIYGGASGVGTRLANGSAGQFLKSQGTTLAPVWANPTLTLTAPTVQKFTSTGSTTVYIFTCSSANATVGATYTNNTQTFTVSGTISSGTLLFATGTGAPTASGTLTRASGTGDSTITFSANVVGATYTTPTSPSPLYLRVRMIGGGGGGSGGNSSAAGNPGTLSVFGTNLLVANGGGGAPQSGGGNIGGTGGTVSVAAGPLSVVALQGGYGSVMGEGNSSMGGGMGGVSPFGGAGAGATVAGGTSAIANSGCGGGGGGANASNTAGAGGGAGGYIEVLITSPASTYTYSVGTGGSGSSGGTSAYAGGTGGSGYLVVEEFYQ